MEGMHRVRKGAHGAPMPPVGAWLLQHLDVFTNLDILQTLLFRVFMDVSLPRHNRQNHCALGINSTPASLSSPVVRRVVLEVPTSW